MTLFIWVDENGNWRVTHLPPTDGSPKLRAIFAQVGDDVPVFFDDQDEIPVTVQ